MGIPRVTIVGGRSPDDHQMWSGVTPGIEQVLGRAGQDKRFARQLVKHRSKTLADPALGLDDVERQILLAVPDSQLRAFLS